MPVGADYAGLGFMDPSLPHDPGAEAYGIGLSGGVRVAVGDATPQRVAAILLAAGAGLAALKLLGFRFNVGVSS